MKLKARFLPSSYIQDSYAQLHNLIKCDIHEPEEQTIIRCLGGLEPKYLNVVELQ